MSNRNQHNPSPTRAGMGTRVKGVFETAHGVGDNIRGRTLGAIDDLTFSSSSESKSRHTSLADRGRTEAETGMAHMYGYADPDVYRQELSRMPNSTGTFGNGHTTGTGPGTGDVRAGQDNHYGRDGRMDGGVGKGTGGYGTDDGYGQPGVQGFEQQQPPIDRNTQMGPVAEGGGGLSPNRAPQNAGSEQRIKRDFPPGLPPRRQAQTTGDDQHGQTYQ